MQAGLDAHGRSAGGSGRAEGSRRCAIWTPPRAADPWAGDDRLGSARFRQMPRLVRAEAVEGAQSGSLNRMSSVRR